MLGKSLLAVIFAVATVHAVDWTDLRGKYNMIHLNSFYQVPRTEADAQNEGWTQSPEAEAENDSRKLKAYSFEKNPSIAALYDLKGSIAAYEISFPTVVDTLNITGVDYSKMGWTKIKRWDQDLYSTTAYLVPQEVIEQGGRDFDGQTGTGLWLKIGEELVEVPNNEQDIQTKTPSFIKQNCFDKMGQHYFYNVSSELTPEGYQPFFLLYDSQGELQGFGMVAFGKKAENANKNFFTKIWSKIKSLASGRDWWELLPSFAVSGISPDTPQWVKDYIDEYGAYSHHVYFKQEPWSIKC